jgi:hypothetical protein
LDGIPAVLVGDEEADDGLAVVPESVLVVGLDDLAGDLLVAELGHLPGELVFEHVGKPLEEDQGQDEVLELGGVLRSPDDAGGVPKPLLQGGHVEMLLRQCGECDGGDRGLGGLLPSPPGAGIRGCRRHFLKRLAGQ